MTCPRYLDLAAKAVILIGAVMALAITIPA